MISLTRVFVAFLFALSLPAQDVPAAKEGGDAGAKGGIRAVDVEVVERGEKEGFDPETGAKSGFKLDKAPAVMTARGHCRFDASIQPRRLLPGQSGRLLMTIMLEGDSVMTSSSALKMTAAEGGMSLGAWSMLPAEPCRIASAFRGQPVYDNWAVVEASVTMPSDARLGEKRHAVLQLEFDLHSGSNGELLGHFRETVNVACEVGATANPVVSLSIPGGPAPQPGAKAAAASGESPRADASKAQADEPVRASPQPAELAAPELQDPAPKAAPGMGPGAELAPAVEESTRDNLMIVGGGAGVVILVIAIFLLRRR